MCHLGYVTQSHSEIFQSHYYVKQQIQEKTLSCPFDRPAKTTSFKSVFFGIILYVNCSTKIFFTKMCIYDVPADCFSLPKSCRLCCSSGGRKWLKMYERSYVTDDKCNFVKDNEMFFTLYFVWNVKSGLFSPFLEKPLLNHILTLWYWRKYIIQRCYLCFTQW